MANKTDNALTLIDKRILTPQIKMLEQLLGITQTYHFLNAFGGQRIELPRHIIKYDHPIAMVLGIQDANRLCHHWHQTHQYHSCLKFQVPTFNTVLLALRKAKICSMNKDLSYNQIADQMNMSYRYVKRFIDNNCTAYGQDIATKTTKIECQVDMF